MEVKETPNWNGEQLTTAGYEEGKRKRRHWVLGERFRSGKIKAVQMK